jgi:hypothetical protein
VRFNAGGPAGLIGRKRPGAAPRLNDGQRQALVAMVRQGPDPAVHGAMRRRLIDLAQWLWEAFRVSPRRTPVTSRPNCTENESEPILDAD